MSSSIVVIRTVDRILGTTSANFRVKLPTPLLNKTSCYLLDASIPQTFYNVCSTSNGAPSSTLTASSSYPSGVAISICQGMYTAANLSSALLAALQSSASSINATSVAYNPISDRIAITGSGTQTITWPSTTGQGDLGWFLGASVNTTTVSSSSGGVWTLTFPAAPRLGGQGTVLVNCPTLGGQPGQCTSGATFAFRLQCLAGNDTLSFHNAGSSTYSQINFTKQTIQQLDFQLTDLAGNVLDPCGAEWTMTLAFT